MRIVKAEAKNRVLDYLEKPGLISGVGFLIWRLYNLLGESLIPSRRRARSRDHEFDKEFGLDTKGWIRLSNLGINSDNVESGNHYQPIRPRLFDKVLSHAQIRHEEFVFIDFGSGKGRALLLASALPFKRIVGVEFSPELHRIAQQNIRKYKSDSQECTDIESVCIDAAQYQIPAAKAIFYFYNPFKEEVLTRVLDNIQKSLEEHPREVFVLYVNPTRVDVLDRFAFDKVEGNDDFALFKSRAFPESASKEARVAKPSI